MFAVFHNIPPGWSQTSVASLFIPTGNAKLVFAWGKLFYCGGLVKRTMAPTTPPPHTHSLPSILSLQHPPPPPPQPASHPPQLNPPIEGIYYYRLLVWFLVLGRKTGAWGTPRLRPTAHEARLNPPHHQHHLLSLKIKTPLCPPPPTLPAPLCYCWLSKGL